MGSLIAGFRHYIYGIGLIVLALSILSMGIFGILNKQALAPKEVNHRGILEVIAQGESKGNYNAYYGNVHNQSVDFTKMTIKEVLVWQVDYVKSGSPSSAVGKYQFIRPTLNGLVQQNNIDEGAYFDEKLQDELAKVLLEKRGLNDYIEGKIHRDQFAHNLSKEWAALPQAIGADPNKSYYEGDGLNHARTRLDEVYAGIEKLEKDGKDRLAKDLDVPKAD